MGSLGMPTLVPPYSNADLVRITARNLCIGIVRTLIAYAKGSPTDAALALRKGWNRGTKLDWFTQLSI